MSKGVKTKKVSHGISQDDMNMLNEMFNQMTGCSNAEPEIIIPKYSDILDNLKKYVKIYQTLINFSEVKNIINIEEFEKFIQSIKDIIDKYTLTDEIKTNSNKLNESYKELKKENIIQMIIVTSGNLNRYKVNLEDKNNLKDDFIKRDPGLSLCPLKFSSLDLKILWTTDISNMAKTFVLSILSHSLTLGVIIYNLISSPDIDIKEFSRVLLDSIEIMKKQVPRCDKAFNIIADSVNLLENNFDKYYKNSIEANNPSIIIENFIVDVSISQKDSASVTHQFKKIIMFMKKKTANTNDPRVSKLFNVLNSQFDMINPSDNNDDDESV